MSELIDEAFWEQYDRNSRREWWLYGLRHPLYEDAWPRIYVEITIGRIKCWRAGGHVWFDYREEYGPSSRMCQRCERFEWVP